MGHLRAPESGDFFIDWDTGAGGTKYDGGEDPHISLNDDGDVVEVHTVTNEGICHYSRGHLSGSTIAFASPHPRLDDDGFHPSVAVLNNKYVMAINVHVKTTWYGENYYQLTYRLGRLRPNDAVHIEWISADEIWHNTTPPSGLATNQLNAVATPGT